MKRIFMWNRFSPVWKERLQTFSIGFAAGAVNGMLGIGGGIFIVPGLILMKGIAAQSAVATSLGAVFFMALAAFSAHITVSGLYFPPEGLALLLLCGALGSQLGGYLLRRLTQRWILYLFALLLEFSALNLVYKVIADAAEVVSVQAPPLWAFSILGGFSGFFSGMLGIGGGGIAVLSFAVLFNTPILEGIPMALLVNMANSASGVVAQWNSRIILWKEVLRLSLSALVGVGVGVGFAVLLPPDALRVIFSGFFMYMGWRLYRRGRGKF
ncbi:MAG: sulfite exporter TauE/SafE family protein [Deltaproteobacteria bacterium]|nr:sulfite exporter TauE/SafE family protein [Deltaproteobacteria bacterium]